MNYLCTFIKTILSTTHEQPLFPLRTPVDRVLTCLLPLCFQRVPALPVQCEKPPLTVTMTPPRALDVLNQPQQQLPNNPAAANNAINAAAAPTRRAPRDYIFGKVIGEGSFSTVYLAKDIHTHQEVASESRSMASDFACFF